MNRQYQSFFKWGNQMKCLKRTDFVQTRFFGDLSAAAESLGYETITDLFLDQYFEQGQSANQLSAQLGFSNGSILKYLRKMSEKRMRDQGGRTASDYEKIKNEFTQLRQQGVRYAKVAAKLGVSVPTVKKWARKERMHGRTI